MKSSRTHVLYNIYIKKTVKYSFVDWSKASTTMSHSNNTNEHKVCSIMNMSVIAQSAGRMFWHQYINALDPLKEADNSHLSVKCVCVFILTVLLCGTQLPIIKISVRSNPWSIHFTWGCHCSVGNCLRFENKKKLF